MRIYSSQTHEKAEFAPIEEGRVRMYVCGPTVYDNIHIGNARTFISFDVIRRWLIASGYEVTFAQNLTDVDDKIINRANEQSRGAEEVALEFSERFIEVMHRANVLDPDVRPRATKEIGPMIGMIKSLIEQGHAYAAENGDVYFSVRSDEGYGVVSGRRIDDLMVGARIEENEDKRDPLDFALWKAAKPGEPSWPSPWGQGRPGWHTECAAMVHRYLGVPIDIHGGGSDLAFPHHENECAQASCAWHQGFANTWMHTGMLLVDGEKMSKSLGNFFTLEEVLEKHSAAALRLLMAQTHYRSPLDFSWERLEGAESSLARIAGTVDNLRWAGNHAGAEADAALADNLARAVEAAEAEFRAQMDDDFNTAGAVAALFTLVTEANVYLEQAGAAADAGAVTAAADTIAQAFDTLGIELPARVSALPAELVETAAELVGYAGDDVDGAAEAILTARAAARAAKDWGRADAIRDELTTLGLAVEDTAAGSRIKQA
ncbi:cysteine--tRNA ligase [Collinsella vaginalis]|uniref:cysteine--tRNA ligase n=1 Tax=Collinsella vaginalis TaxID=1870987 RepID=UPI000A271C14|nr:cysteine--tRNA ligase [Collinsella vaginalis]